MSKTRIYAVGFRGTRRFVEATSRSTAKSHVIKVEVAKVRDDIESCDAASALDVANFARGGGRIEKVGEEPPAPEENRAQVLFEPEREHEDLTELGGAEGEEAARSE